jgi:hypothetical protein
MSSAPLLVENFPIGYKGLKVKCGAEHTALICAFEDKTKLFTWGGGKLGATGHGCEENAY